MDSSICNFMPVKNYSGGLKTVHFVYETEFKILAQPFLHPIYYCNLVTSGTARLKLCGEEYVLNRGTLYFGFPAVPYEIDGGEDFKYLYISFMGPGAEALLNELEISWKHPVYDDFAHIVDFWFSSISRINPSNANILSESALLYALSFISNSQKNIAQKRNSQNLFEMIVDYIDNHYMDPDISVNKVANIFFYTEKYLSYLFKHNMKIGFNPYLNDLRIRHARELIANNVTSVSKIAAMCGYSNSLYFSKVFRKKTGMSPTEYMKQLHP